jgi:uncharacterized protein (DUF488 family)
MKRQGLLSERDSHIVLVDTKDYFQELTISDQNIIKDIKSKFGGMSSNDLIRHVYLNYPFYAINSTIVQDVLTPKELEKVEKQKSHFNESKLFTIGYEGKSLELYLELLIKNDVRVLCDVRKNAYSQKYGFKKSQLEKVCKGVGIKYIHTPELGIESDMRRNLSSQDDYDALFDYYEKNTLLKNWDCLLRVRNIINQEGRVALTCFEQNPKQCHRSRVAKALMSLEGVNYSFGEII